jgi:hypothetical protein
MQGGVKPWSAGGCMQGGVKPWSTGCCMQAGVKPGSAEVPIKEKTFHIGKEVQKFSFFSSWHFSASRALSVQEKGEECETMLLFYSVIGWSPG